MKTSWSRLGAAVMLLSGMSGTALAQTQLTLLVSVSATTCDVTINQGPMLNVGHFTPADFTSNSVTLPGNQSFTLSFPPGGCKNTPVTTRNALSLRVSGPVARGSHERDWGDAYDDVAYGVRLRYEQNGVSGAHPLTPKDNRLVLNTAPGARDANSIPDVVMRPEVRTWDHTRVDAGTALAIPLVFSVAYE